MDPTSTVRKRKERGGKRWKEGEGTKGESEGKGKRDEPPIDISGYVTKY